jgi:hypothetical protein
MTNYSNDRDRDINFMKHWGTWPMRHAPKAVIRAIKAALIPLDRYEALDYAVNDLPDDIIMAKAVWDLRAAKAVANDQPLPSKEPVEREEIRLATAKAELNPALNDANRAANGVGSVISANAAEWSAACNTRAEELVNHIGDTLAALLPIWREADELLNASYLLQTQWGKANAQGPSTGDRHLPGQGLAGTVTAVRAITPWAPVTPPAAVGNTAPTHGQPAVAALK